MSLTVRYPGRVCLLGEHCDWAGGASLTVPLGLGVSLTAEEGSDRVGLKSVMDGELLEGRWPLRPDRGAVDTARGPLRFVPAALFALARAGVAVPPSELLVTADLPTGRGFSSSAAFCLAALDGLSRRAGRVLEAEVLAELAYEVEHDLAGVACGRLDQHACAAGAPLFFRWEDGLPETRPVSVHRPLPLVVAAFPTPRDTPAILAALQEAHAEGMGSSSPAAEAVREALGTWASAAEAGAHAVETGDLLGLGEAMNACQEVYDRALAPTLPALVAPALRRTTRWLRLQGALGAKFSGAGGDGSLVALLESAADADRITAGLRERGLSVWSFTVEGP